MNVTVRFGCGFEKAVQVPGGSNPLVPIALRNGSTQFGSLGLEACEKGTPTRPALGRGPELHGRVGWGPETAESVNLISVGTEKKGLYISPLWGPRTQEAREVKNRDPSTICANPFWATSAPSWRFGSACSRCEGPKPALRFLRNRFRFAVPVRFVTFHAIM